MNCKETVGARNRTTENAGKTNWGGLIWAVSVLAAAVLVAATTSTPGSASELPGNIGSAAEMTNGSGETFLQCNSRASIVGDLKNGYSEQPIALGVTSAGTVMELWTAANGNTWTLIVTLTNGDSCVIGAGDGWTTIEKTAKGEDL